MGEAFEPPFVVGAGVAVAPVAACHRAGRACEIRIVEPIVGATDDGARIAPIVIAVAVRGEMDVAYAGTAGIVLVIPNKPLPHVLLTPMVAVRLLHDRFSAMAEALQHLAHAPLKVEPHDDEPSLCIR